MVAVGAFPRSGKRHIRSKTEGAMSLCGLRHYREYPVRFRGAGEQATCRTCLRLSGEKPREQATVWERLLAEDGLV